MRNTCSWRSSSVANCSGILAPIALRAAPSGRVRGEARSRLRANGICNTLGRAATIVSPFIVVALFKDYGVRGVLSLMIGLLIIQIIVVALWGIEPARRRLEDLESTTGGADAARHPAQA